MPELKMDERVKRGNLIKARPHDLIARPDFNPRLEGERLEAHVEGLTVAILRGDKMPPLEVKYTFDKQMVIVDGHCRHRAYLRAIERGAEIEYIEVIEFKGNDVDENFKVLAADDGLRLDPLERGMMYKRLRGYGWDSQKIADRCNKSITHVNDLLMLSDAPQDVQNLIASGTMAAATVLEQLKVSPGDAVDVLKQASAKAAEGGKTRVTPKDVKKVREPLPRTAAIFKKANHVIVLDTLSALRQHVANQMPSATKSVEEEPPNDDTLVQVPYSLIAKILKLGEAAPALEKEPNTVEDAQPDLLSQAT